MEPVAVYGATGYTGRLVALELARREMAMVLSGRNRERLEAVATELGGGAELRPAALDDPAALRTAFAGCGALINCAGPFVRHGRPVLEAALAARVPYLDTTGEQGWIRRVFDSFDARAREAGVAVVPAMGFDYAPGDLLCALAAEGVQPLRELVVAYAMDDFGMTRGTLRSGLEMADGTDVVFTDGGWQPAGAGPLRARLRGVPMARYPAGEVITVPRHVRTAKVTALLTARTFAGGERGAAAAPFVLPAVGALLSVPRVKDGLHAAIGRLPEGPGEAARRRASYAIDAIAHGEDGRVRTARLTGTDVYGITAVLTVEGARRLTEVGGESRSGTLAPAQAFAPRSFLAALEPHGVTYEVAG